MNILSIILSITLTFFSSMVLAYISVATMIGPWIAPTIVLISGLILRLHTKMTESEKIKEMALIQTVGSVGGIVATAVGFTLPTLYFLDRGQFETMTSNPIGFCFFIAVICIAAGSFGILLGRAFKNKLINKENLPLPVSHLIHKTITSQTQSKQAKKLLAGFSVSTLICLVRDGFKTSFFKIPSLLPSREIYLFSSVLQDKFPILIMPMLWAIGFIVGTSIALPLLVGMLSKYFVMHPLNNHSLFLPFKLFDVINPKLFSMAFCSGLILADVLPGILKYPAIIWKSIKQYSGYSFLSKHHFDKLNVFKIKDLYTKLLNNSEALISLILTVALFSYIKFPLLALVGIIPLTAIAAYHISYIGGKIGLVQIGRFVTFVMIPTMLLFKLNSIQITVLCIFVSICITTTADFVFDYKVGELCNIKSELIHRYQWLGVILTAACLGFFFWLLTTNLQLGTTELFAQRGRARALLIQSFSFNWIVVILGLLYGFILKKLRISPSMVFGGLLMPNGLTIGLVLGSLGTLLVKGNKERYLPLCSGIFAGESIWLIFSIISRAI